MSWQDDYAIARSMLASSDRLFAAGEHQYASEGVWGALQYAAKALVGRYGRAPGSSLNRGYIPELANEPEVMEERAVRWDAAHRLHRHFYNNNLNPDQRREYRASAGGLLDEAFGVLEA